MKLILAVIRDIDSEPVINELIKGGYRISKLASTGGFLRRGNMTLMIGVDDHDVQIVIDLMRSTVGPPEEDQHRVTVFVLNALASEQF